jgi:hypothetical protein
MQSAELSSDFSQITLSFNYTIDTSNTTLSVRQSSVLCFEIFEDDTINILGDNPNCQIVSDKIII